jgi:hypothetical protein
MLLRRVCSGKLCSKLVEVDVRYIHPCFPELARLFNEGILLEYAVATSLSGNTAARLSLERGLISSFIGGTCLLLRGKTPHSTLLE